MGKVIECERMMARLKAPRIGERVRVRSCEIYFELPAGLPEWTECVLVGRESGRYIVDALGTKWNIPIQCLVHEEERLLNGVWLDRWDRRVRRAEAMLARMAAAGKLDDTRR